MYPDLIMAAHDTVGLAADLGLSFKATIFDVIKDLANDTTSTVKAVMVALALIALGIGWWTNGRTIGGFIGAFVVAALVVWGVNSVDWGKDTIDETITQSENDESEKG